MPKYLVTASYTADGVQGLLEEGGSSRQETIGKLVEGMGGNVESFYYAFGEADVYVIVEVPDEETMLAIALAVGAGGAASLSTTVLIDPATIDAATKKTVNYRRPGADSA